MHVLRNGNKLATKPTNLVLKYNGEVLDVNLNKHIMDQLIVSCKELVDQDHIFHRGCSRKVTLPSSG